MMCTKEWAQGDTQESARDEGEGAMHEVCRPRHEENRERDRRKNSDLTCRDAAGSTCDRGGAPRGGGATTSTRKAKIGITASDSPCPSRIYGCWVRTPSIPQFSMRSTERRSSDRNSSETPGRRNQCST